MGKLYIIPNASHIEESLALAEAGRWCAFAAYAVGSVSVGIVAVALGYWLAKN